MDRSKIVEVASEQLLSYINELPQTRADAVGAILTKYDSFLRAPASCSNHHAYPGGLLVHSIQVMEISLNFSKVLNFEGRESIIIAGLFHDFGKLDCYEPSDGRYKKKVEVIPHSAYSLELLQREQFPLSSEEYQAILMHNGLYTEMGAESKGREYKLTHIIHWADVWSAMHLKN